MIDPATRDHDLDTKDLPESRETGLLLGFVLPRASAQSLFAVPSKPKAENVLPGAVVREGFVRIDENGIVTLGMPMAEMNQEEIVSPTMLLAEELDVRVDQIRVHHRSSEVLCTNCVGDIQSTTDPVSFSAFWAPLRQAGAVIRHLLTEAAAKEWDVDPGTCLANNGVVFDASGSRYLRYGELVNVAAKLPVPPAEEVKLKDPRNFTILGDQAKWVV